MSQIDAPTVGVITVMSAEHNLKRDHVINRIRALAEELHASGVSEVICWPALGRRRNFLKLLGNGSRVAGIEIVGSRGLAKRLSGKAFLVVDQSQYHTPREWMSDLMSKAFAQNKVIYPAAQDDELRRQISHQRINAFHFAVPASVSASVSKFMASRTMDVLAPVQGLNAIGIDCEKAPITVDGMLPMYKRAATMDKPVNFNIELNSDCNYRCLMCPYHGGRQNREPTFIKPGTAKMMDIEVFKSLVDQAAAIERPFEDPNAPIRLTPYLRGELLLHPDWREAIEYVISKGFECYFSTNGSTWTESDIEYVLDLGVERIQVSINGHTSEIHRLLRLNDEYEQVANTAINLVRRRIERGLERPIIQASNIYTDRTAEHIDDYVAYWIDRVDSIEIGPENYVDEANYNRKYMVEHGVSSAPRPESRPPCSMIKDYLVISSEGEGMLCYGSAITTTGNAIETGLEGILNSPIRSEIIEAHAKGEFDNKTCKSCQQWYGLYTLSVTEKLDYIRTDSAGSTFYDRKTLPRTHHL